MCLPKAAPRAEAAFPAPHKGPPEIRRSSLISIHPSTGFSPSPGDSETRPPQPATPVTARASELHLLSRVQSGPRGAGGGQAQGGGVRGGTVKRGHCPHVSPPASSATTTRKHGPSPQTHFVTLSEGQRPDAGVCHTARWGVAPDHVYNPTGSSPRDQNAGRPKAGQA